MKPSTQKQIQWYVEHRLLPGSFVRAVLENNLLQAVMYADSDNARDLCEIVEYCFNNIPGNCWGSYERVMKYLEGKP